MLSIEARTKLEREKGKFANLTSDLKLTGLAFNRDGFSVAIKRAIRDLTARTLRPREGVSEGDTLTNQLLKNDEGSFLNQIIDYFDADPIESETDFDKWHHRMCECVLTDINRYYKNPDNRDVCYGKAQKIVNMAMKGCYCLEGSAEKEGHFKYCHLPLDSFTLEWFYREVVTNWCNDKSRSDRIKGIRKASINSWSNLEYSNTNDDDNENIIDTCGRIAQYKTHLENRTSQGNFYHYMFIQDVIRDFFKKQETGITETRTAEQEKYKEYTPFQAEFFIWPEIQLHLSTEVLFGQSIGQEEILDKLREMLSIQNATEISNKERTLERAREKGLKTAKYIEKELVKLKGGKDMADAANIYKGLPLPAKIKLLAEKINILMSYCNIDAENQQ